MNERLQYEERLDQAWETLPLPDEDMAWKDMKRRLDDDDDKIVVPPPRRGCGMGALLIGLLLLTGLWFILRPEKWFTKKETQTVQQTGSIPTQRDTQKVKAEVEVEVEVEKKKEEKTNNNEDVVSTDTRGVPGDTSHKLSAKAHEGTSKTGTGNPDIKKITKQSNPLTIKDEVSIQTNSPQAKKKLSKTQPVTSNEPKDVLMDQDKKVTNNDDAELDSSQNKKDVVQDGLTDNLSIVQKDTVTNQTKLPVPPTNILPVDSSKNKIDQRVVATDKDSVTATTKTPKQEVREERPIFFSAGLGLHQQIPIAGQEWTTYGSLGRRGILTDYIPSVNFRMEKQERWFLQTEFRYGAPQHTNQLTYSQKIQIDTFTQSIITNSSVVKKTFYHQVPLTFNYYLLPDWSVGTGLQWNRFQSAVAEQEVKRRRPGTNIDSVISKNIVKVSNDSSSAFVNSWFQGIFQTQYQWKRFSIGARYSFGLQPYIKFMLPNQPPQQEKNSSFQIFLRYELWRSNN